MMFSATVWKDHDGAFSMSTQSSDFYTRQDGFFGLLARKLKNIWYIIRNKEYSYCEVCFNKEDMLEFRDYINRIAEKLEKTNMDW